MHRQLFEKFYNEAIQVIANEIIRRNSEFSFKNNLDGVYEEYLNQRTALRYLIKSDSMLDRENGSILLDGHKVSACITCAIIKVRLITCSQINDSENEMYSLSKANRMNEQLALLSGLTCLLSYMAEEQPHLYPRSQSDKKIKLILPETKYQNRSTYLDSLVRGLYYSNLISTINPLLLSHIYFMIEQYHRKCVELEDAKNGYNQTPLS